MYAFVKGQHNCIMFIRSVGVFEFFVVLYLIASLIISGTFSRNFVFVFVLLRALC